VTQTKKFLANRGYLLLKNLVMPLIRNIIPQIKIRFVGNSGLAKSVHIKKMLIRINSIDKALIKED
jgi:hypothetical protein